MRTLALSLAAVLLLTAPAAAQETETLYLSGTGRDDAVDWELSCTKGRHCGPWTTIPVPSQWEPSVTYKPDFGPTPDAFTKAFEDRFHIRPGYHAAGGYAAGLVLQHAIEQAGAIETDAVAEALDGTDATTFYGHIRFATGAADHGLQIGHDMVLAQWQKGTDGKLRSQVVWPADAKTAPILYPLKKLAQ